jgi:hypothetical protein
MSDEGYVVDFRTTFAILGLIVFVLASTIGGFLLGAAWGFLALGAAALVASYLLGSV